METVTHNYSPLVNFSIICLVFGSATSSARAIDDVSNVSKRMYLNDINVERRKEKILQRAMKPRK